MKIAKYILPKLLRKNIKIFLSLVFISALGVGVLTSMLNTYEGVKRTFTDYFEEYSYPDVTVFSSQPFTRDTLDRVSGLDGVTQVQGRLCIDAEATYDNGNFVSLRCYSADDGDMVRYYVMESLPEKEWGDYIPMALNSNFVKMTGFQLGDIFELHMNGQVHSCILAKVVVSPECVAVYRDDNSTYSTDEFGYAYFAYEDLMQMTGLPRNIYNQVLIGVGAEAVSEEVERSVKDSDIFLTEVQSYTYESSPHKLLIDDCVEPLKSMSYLISAVFFVIAVAMIYLFMYQVIMEQKEKSGILMALGGSSGQIAAIYFAFAAVVTLCAGIVGNLLGCFLMKLIGKLYQNAFDLPFMKEEFSILLEVGSVALVGMIIMLAIFLAALQILKLEPSEAMHKQPQVNRGSTFKGFDLLGYACKVCFSCSMRNKRRLFLSFLSTILTVALITFAFQYSDACDYAIDRTYSERYLYDCQVFFESQLRENQVQELLEKVDDQIHAYEPFLTENVQLKSEHGELDSTIYGICGDAQLLQLQDDRGNALTVQGDGIVLSALDAEKLSVESGDSITVNGIKLKVDGIYDANLFFVQYVNTKVFERISDSGFAGAYLMLNDGATREQIHEQLKDEAGFGYLSMKNSQAAGVGGSLSKLDAAVLVIIMLSFAVGMVIIYNMAVINYEERKRIFSIMMALGMKTSEVSWASLAEILIQYVVSVVVGIVIGLCLGEVLLDAMSTDSVQYAVAFSAPSGVFMAVCVGIFMLAGQLFALLKLRSLDMAEELKSRE